MRHELDTLKRELDTNKLEQKNEVQRLLSEIKNKDETAKAQAEQQRIVGQERDNLRKRVSEVESRLAEKEDVVDNLRKEYNELLEKYLKTPKKITTVSNTVKTTVETDDKYGDSLLGYQHIAI